MEDMDIKLFSISHNKEALILLLLFSQRCWMLIFALSDISEARGSDVKGFFFPPQMIHLSAAAATLRRLLLFPARLF